MSGPRHCTGSAAAPDRSEKPLDDETTARGFALREGLDPEPATDVLSSSLSSPGPPLVVHRGETAEITVVNLLSEPTTIHWHGLELESVFDETDQLVQGMVGAFIVLEPGATFDPELDRVFVISGQEEGAYPVSVNGDREPPPEDFRVGREHRLSSSTRPGMDQAWNS